MTRPPAPDAFRIDAELAARLVAEQFPRWAGLPVVPVENGGHDNRTFRLGDGMSIRIPCSAAHAAHLPAEQRWLPKLAPHLPLPVPVPLAIGRPARGLAWRWSIRTWLAGETAAPDRIDDLERFASDLAAFLGALQRIPTHGGPRPGRDNFFRGGALAIYDGETRRCIAELQDVIDARRATEAWDAALEAAWRGPPAWVHGDVAAANLLVQGGRLCAVIDFGQTAVGDPACDVTIAWTFLTGESREAFRRKLSADAGTWARGRGWGLWKALRKQSQERRPGTAEAAEALRVVEDILSEHP